MGIPGRSLPSKGKSGWLLKDTRQMEEKLAELRLRMEDEQRERQRRLDAGRVWASSDAPRPLISKHQIVGRGNMTLESSLRQAAASKALAFGCHTPAGSSYDQLSKDALSYRRSPSHQEIRLDEQASRRPHGTSTVMLHSTSLAEGSFDEDDSRRSFLAALDHWRGKSNHGLEMQAVDVASGTENSSNNNGNEQVDLGCPASVFQRILLIKATKKAGDAAASKCQFHTAKGSSEPDHIPAPAPPRTIGVESRECKTGCFEALAGDEATCVDHYKQHLTKYAMEPIHLEVTQGEEAVVLSVTNLDPYQVLTSSIRFPDDIILPD